MNKLDKNSVWLFFIRGLFALSFFAVSLGIIPTILFIGLTLEKEGNPNALGAQELVFIVVLFWIGLFLFLCVISYISALLQYRFYKYELGKDGFKKEFGFIQKRYTIIPYDRIQNIDIKRTLFARILGLSELYIQTAGTTSSQFRGAEGRLPGITKVVAEQLRDELVQKSKRSNNQDV